MAKRKGFRAFVSSTFVDLKDHRAHVIRALRRASIQVDPMEDWTADSDEPKAFSQQRVEDCDLCVLLVAFRRGFVPDGESQSITQLEYNRAVVDGMDVLVFLLDDDAPWPRRFDEMLTDTGENGIAAWRDQLQKKHGVEMFGLEASSIDVLPAVSRWLQKRLGKRAPKQPAKYLQLLHEQTAYIDIRGLQVGSGQANRFPIEELFIPLTTILAPSERRRGLAHFAESSEQNVPVPLSLEGIGSEKRKTEDIPLHEARRVELHEALCNRRLVIIGDPGAGKTTFLYRIAAALCKAHLGLTASDADHLGLDDQPFPLLIRLFELAEHIDTQRGNEGAPSAEDAPAWLPHLLAAKSKDEETGLDEPFFQELLTGGKAIVLLDGLDEAAGDDDRRRIRDLVEKAITAYKGCRFVLTSRPVAYGGELTLHEFQQVRIDPLEPETVSKFLDRWCEALFPDSPERAKAHQAELVEALRSRLDIRRIVRNPVMLTALAVVHWNEKRLPEERADLYESIITWLSRSRQRRPGRKSPRECVELLQELALAMQDHDEGRQVQVPRRWAAEQLVPNWSDEPANKRVAAAEDFLVQEELDSGIVVARGNEIRFWHLTFQEYLAARAVAARSDEQQTELLYAQSKFHDPAWKEVVLLLAGVLHGQGRQKVDGMFAAVLDHISRKKNKPSPAERARCVALLGGAVRDLAPVNYEPADPRFKGCLEALEAIFDRRKSLDIPIKEAIEVAEAIGQAGDVRFDHKHRDKNWITIPASEFLMGAQREDANSPNYDADAFKEESPVHKVYLDEFQIARYPVTVGEFAEFIDDGGYQDEKYWQAGGFGKFQQPGSWDEQQSFPNRPVVEVSWFEAVAYAQWAGCQLPTEAQWERAARGVEGRKYPWGNDEPNERLTNYAGNIGRVTPVGVYPCGGTPDAIEDLGGNVWEWCTDRFGDYDGADCEKPTGPKQGKLRVLRGGAWLDHPILCRASYRGGYRPSLRVDSIGFRLVRVVLAARTQ